MKHIIFILVLVLLMNQHSFAQAQNKSGIYFGATVGTRFHSFDKHFQAAVTPQFTPFTIGAGSAWTSGKYLVGFDFLYAAANKENAAGRMQYIGFSQSLWFGYNVFRQKNWSIEPNFGLVLHSNQLIVQSKVQPAFQDISNNPLSGSVGINLRVLDSKGLFSGLKLGYMIPFSGITPWENNLGGNSAGIKDNVGAFYVQIILGGLLKLGK